MVLEERIVEAVVDLIEDRFIRLEQDDEDKGLCYSWPMYLGRQPDGSRFWDTLHGGILEVLRNTSILWSRNERLDLKKPTMVRYVPEEYRFEGDTVFNLPSINETHLSFGYDHVYEYLKAIGVSGLSLRDLCEEFCQWVKEVRGAGLDKMSDGWHGKVARIFTDEGEWIKEKMKALPIIPLRDGSWVKATEKNLYLPSPNKNEHVPCGINILVVAQDAAQDEWRKQLYQHLDIEQYTLRQVCKLILEFHRNLTSRWTGRSNEELIADIAYLFSHRSKIGRHEELGIFLVVHKDGDVAQVPRRSSRICLVDPNSRHGLISKYKDTPGNPFGVLSDG